MGRWRNKKCNRRRTRTDRPARGGSSRFELIAEGTITTPKQYFCEWDSSGDDDVYDDIYLVVSDAIGTNNASVTLAFRTNFNTTNLYISQSNIISETTQKTFRFCCERYLEETYHVTKAVANAQPTIQIGELPSGTKYENKINRVRGYLILSGSTPTLTSGTYKLYGRRRKDIDE